MEKPTPPPGRWHCDACAKWGSPGGWIGYTNEEPKHTHPLCRLVGWIENKRKQK